MKKVFTLILALALCLGIAVPALAEEVRYDPPLATSYIEEHYTLSLIFSDVIDREEPVTIYNYYETELFRVSQGSTITFEYLCKDAPDSFPTISLAPAEYRDNGSYMEEYGERDYIRYYDKPHTITLDQPGLWFLSIDPFYTGAPFLKGMHVVLDVVGDGTATTTTPTPASDTPAVVRSPQNVTVNGAAVMPDIYNINDNNYFKLRDLGDALGFGADYDAATNTAIITSK